MGPVNAHIHMKTTERNRYRGTKLSNDSSQGKDAEQRTPGWGGNFKDLHEVQLHTNYQMEIAFP